MGLSLVRRTLHAPVRQGEGYVPAELDLTDERTARLCQFVPSPHRNLWAEHKLIIVDLVLRTRFVSHVQDTKMMSTVHEMFCWAHSQGYRTEPQELLCGDRIDQFVMARYPNQGSWATYRWRLRSVGAAVFPGPIEQAFDRKPVLAPHSANDRLRHLTAVSLISSHRTNTRIALHRDTTVILALSYGAGCNSTHLHRVRESWLHHHDAMWWLHRPDRAAPSPIAEPFGSQLADLRSGDQSAWFLRPDTPTHRNQQAGKILQRARTASASLTGFDIDRAARRWETDLLDAFGFNALAATLGYRPGRQVPGDLVPYLSPITSEQATHIVHSHLNDTNPSTPSKERHA